MRRTFLFLIIYSVSDFVFAQQGVGIGVTNPDPSAALHIQAPTDNKGLLIPRLTTTQRNGIANPVAEGLLVYDTDVNELLHYNGGWKPVGVPSGTIVMWSGNPASLPFGWALCDGGGAPARPDLRERFIVGAGGNNLDVAGAAYPVGANGGLTEVTLTVSQMPSHTHTMSNGGAHTHNYQAPLVSGDHPGGNSGYARPNGVNGGNTGSTGSAHSHTILPQGGNQPHENRPPYYALAFIIKL